MNLEVGKRYKTRDGKNIVTILSHSPQRCCPFLGELDDGFTNRYNSDGRFYRHCSDDRDLVSEVKGIKIELGKMYRTRDGRVFHMVRKSHITGYAFVGESIGAAVNRSTAFTINGCYNMTEREDIDDLVEEVVDTPNPLTQAHDFGMRTLYYHKSNTVDSLIKEIETIVGRKVQLTIL